MEKKRSVGVTVIGIVMLLYSLLVLILFALRSPFYLRSCISNFFRPAIILLLVRKLMLLLYFIAGIGILRVKSWGRYLALFVSILLLLFAIGDFLPATISIIKNPEGACDVGWCGIVGILLLFVISAISLFFVPVLCLFYLTRPKVKERFRENSTS